MERILKSSLFVFVLFIVINSSTILSQSSLLSQGFETGDPVWTSQTGWSIVTSGSSPTASPHSGSKFIRFNSYNLGSGTTAYLISNSFDLSSTTVDNRPYVIFWMYRDNELTGSLDRISVYINTSTSTSGQVYLGTINRSTTQSPAVSSTGWYKYFFELPDEFVGAENYLQFKGISAYGNNIFIDDVSVDYLENLSITSSTTEQVSENTLRPGSVNNKIIRLDVVTSGVSNPIALTSIKFNTTGTTLTTDISSAKVYYTTSSTFSTAVQFGSAQLNLNGEFTITGTQTLATGNNYFWLSYDLSASAVGGNLIDAQCVEFTTNQAGNPVINPTVTNPDGSASVILQLTGTKTISSAGGSDYTNLYSAISALNAAGVGAGGVTFLITDGEVFEEPGLITITESGTAEKPIIIKQSGTGAKPVLKFTGTSNSGEACIKLDGADYITIDGIEIRDDNDASSSNVEYGLFFNGTATNGCNNNTVKNCVIDLNPAYQLTKGVYLSSSAQSNDATNSYNKFYNNKITECYKGYDFAGNYNYSDNENIIGTINDGVSELTALGGTVGYAVYGITITYQKDISIFNTKLSNFTSSGTYFIGLDIRYSNYGTTKIYNNEITNFSSTNTSSDISLTAAYIHDCTATVEFYNNTIKDFTLDTERFKGIECYSSNTKIFNNKIYNIQYTGSSYKTIYGMYFDESGTSYIYNNMIYNLRSPNSASYSAAEPNVVGIYVDSPGGTFATYFDNNTVFMNYTSTNANNRSAAIFVKVPSYGYTNTVVLRNNIFVNNNDVTIGDKAVAFWYSGTTYTNFSTLSDRNLYYAGTPSSKNYIFYNTSTGYSNIRDYRNHIATRDQISYTELPPFVSTTGEYDVHLKTDVPTQVEGGGIPITSPVAITKDIDDNQRNATTPDIGADEGDFTFGNDAFPPTISFTDLIDDIVAESRVISGINVTDKSGVEVSSGTKPRIYYKKSSDENSFNDNTNATDGWKYVEASNSESPFTFTIDYTKLKSYPLVSGNTIQYFIVAQDLAVTPNVGINTGTFAVYPGSVELTSANFPISGTIKSFIIKEGVQGVILVGTGQTYTTLTAIGGLFEKINNSVVTGNITVKITSDLTETGATALNQFNNAYSITIQPDDPSLKIILGSCSNGLLRFNGADNITIDGSCSGEGKYLSITNTNESNANAAIQFISLGSGQGSSNNTVQNCTLYSKSYNLATYGIYIGGSNVNYQTGALDNNNYTIRNNTFYKLKYAICAVGVSSSKNQDYIIESNFIGDKGAYNYIGQFAIYISQVKNCLIKKNEIFNVINSNYYLGKLRAIFISTGSESIQIEKNKIYDVNYQNSSDKYGAGGIEINTGIAESNIKVYNNCIGRVMGTSSNTSAGENANLGIGIINATGGVKIYNNSIDLAGKNGNYGYYSIGLYIGASVTGVELINNSIYNSTTYSINATAKSYAIYCAAPAAAFTNINYNNYYATGTQGVLGYLGSEKTNITDWKLATGQDNNSQSVDPMYLNDCNLQPVNGSPLLSMGSHLEDISTDILDAGRNASTPSIGAYESYIELPIIDWCNLETGNKSSIVGVQTYFNAKIYEPGITDNIFQGPNVNCWIGYSRVNTDPSTWADSSWFVASYNTNQTEIEGREEYTKTMGLSSTGSFLPVGTYYVASRFKLKYGDYKYGGYSALGGGFWQEGVNTSSILTITQPVISWVNCDDDNPAQIGLGANADFCGRIQVDGLTTLNTSAGTRIKCWIGFNSTNTNPSTWESSVWVEAEIYNYRTTFHATQDQYGILTGSQLNLGTYYVATRFTLDNGSYVYGGYSTDGGGIWDGINNNNCELNVVQSVISWANLSSPATINVADGGIVTIEGTAYVENVTDQDDSCRFIKAWVGFSSENTNPNTWTYWKQAYFSVDGNEGDQYIFESMEPFGAGTTYYAFRYQFGSGDFVYGGYSADGGGIWDGANYISGVMTVAGIKITTFPFFEGFEGEDFLPTSWRSNVELGIILAENSHSGSYAAGIEYDHNPYPLYLQTPKIDLGTNMRVRFWWMDEDPDEADVKNSMIKNGGLESPKIITHDTTYFEITTDKGLTWEKLGFLSKESQDLVYSKQIFSLAGYANKQISLRWRDVTDGTELAYGFLLDDVSIEKIPDQTNNGNIPAGSGNNFNFGNTGVGIQFTVPNGGALTLNVERIQSTPGGTLPDDLVTLAPRYWVITVDEGALTGGATYTVTLDLTGIAGITNYNEIHLLKRENPSGSWVDYGIPSDISAAPILKWTGLTSFCELGLGSTENNAFPVELAKFSAIATNDIVTLNWSTATEIDLNKFVIERAVKSEKLNWEELGSIQAVGNSYKENDYSFEDIHIIGGSKFVYRLKMIDNDGTINFSKNVEIEIIPTKFEVFQNYPNPFNPETTIKFSLPNSTRVNLVVYNAIGQKVIELINNDYEAGFYEYKFNASSFASGVYYYNLSTPEANVVKKMLLIK